MTCSICHAAGHNKRTCSHRSAGKDNSTTNSCESNAPASPAPASPAPAPASPAPAPASPAPASPAPVDNTIASTSAGDTIASTSASNNISLSPNKLKRLARLSEHLEMTAIDHKLKIMEEATLKEAHAYCVEHNVSAQQYGPALEKYIITKHKYTKNNASSGNGDAAKDGKNVEIKVSLGGMHRQKFNYVQIRPQQEVDMYILTAYYLTRENCEQEGELYIFHVSKDAIKDIMLQHGSYAHGTKKVNKVITVESLNDPHNDAEYAIRPTFGDDCWNALMKFRIDENKL